MGVHVRDYKKMNKTREMALTSRKNSGILTKLFRESEGGTAGKARVEETDLKASEKKFLTMTAGCGRIKKLLTKLLNKRAEKSS